MRSYIHLVKDGMYEEAAALVRESLPFPAITGRVCPHPCESDCARQEVDSAVNINALERFIGDYSLQRGAVLVPRRSMRPKWRSWGPVRPAFRAPISWPRQGYAVTIFEAMSQPGGMLQAGHPRVPVARWPSSIPRSRT